MPDAIVWDAEPIVAYLADEEGADVVEEYLERMTRREFHGFVNPVQLTETLYILERITGVDQTETMRKFVDRLRQHDVGFVASADIWQAAATYTLDGHSLGDSYVLATAESVAAEGDAQAADGDPIPWDATTLLVGADEDFDDVEIDGVTIERFRERSV